jgi:hypothetical protein
MPERDLFEIGAMCEFQAKRTMLQVRSKKEDDTGRFIRGKKKFVFPRTGFEPVSPT